MASAQRVISELPTASDDAIRTAVNGSFLHAMAIGSLVAAAIVLAGAVAVARLLPAHAPQSDHGRKYG